MNKEKASIRILRDAIELQIKKDQDYNQGSVSQSDYYTYGIWSILDTIHAKYLRLRSVLEQIEIAEKEGVYKSPNFESVNDSFIDMINYASFGAAWLTGEVPGQDKRSGLFSNKVPKNINEKNEDCNMLRDEFQTYIDNTFEKISWQNERINTIETQLNSIAFNKQGKKK